MELKPWPRVQSVLPPLSTEERAALKQSLQSGAVNQPILHLPDGRIIEGHHRWELSDHTYPYLQELDISEDEAFALAVNLNIARRQLSTPQQQAIVKILREEFGKSQAEAASVVGVTRQTVDNWEDEIITNANLCNSYNSNPVRLNPPDNRVSVPKSSHETIYDRYTGGETQAEIAADYKVTQPAIAKIVKQVEARLAREQREEIKPVNLPITLYHSDSFVIVPTLPDASLALIITDPPYNTSPNAWDKIGSDADYLLFTAKWLDMIKPKLTPEYHLFFFCDPDYSAPVEMLLRQDGWPIKSRIIWEYRNLVMGRDVTDKFIENWQMCFHCGNHKLNWSKDWDDSRFMVQQHAAPQSNFKEGKNHQMQKPLELLKLLVEVGSKPGDRVLDLFAGGGSTGKAVLEVGQRECILIEREDEFCKAIELSLGIERQLCLTQE